MQHEAATALQHGTLKALAEKVLERNTAARHACNIASDEVLHRGVAHREPIRQPRNTSEPLECIKTENQLPQSKEPPPSGAERGYLTLEDMPELQKRLELSGWKVERRGDQLICWTPRCRKPRIQ